MMAKPSVSWMASKSLSCKSDLLLYGGMSKRLAQVCATGRKYGSPELL